MGKKKHNADIKYPATNRHDRLKAALKANLKRRKAQARVRNAVDPDSGEIKD